MKKQNKYYLVPMWNYKNHKMKDHLALIEAKDSYHAMLIAMGSHNWTTINGDYSEQVSHEDQWNVDMNYETYYECDNPKEIFTYMPKDDSITTYCNIEKEDQYMDIYDYMYWGDYNAQIQTLAEKALPEKWSFEEKTDYYILKKYLK